jgi:hypothetical protein
MLDDGGKSSVGLFGVQRPPRQILVVRLIEFRYFSGHLCVVIRPFLWSHRVVSGFGLRVAAAAGGAALMSNEVRPTLTALVDVLAVFVAPILMPVAVFPALHPRWPGQNRTNKTVI